MYAIIKTGGKQYKVQEGDVMPGEQIVNRGGWRDDYEPMKA